ncbi:hypothetical protein A7D21_27395 [Pseudomonas sp. AP19]|uniref:hypothetical protein n=1 Tax=Pseudomonas TaxID=286 RepID=UPI00084AFED8|nr:hypothetical protein [Pseudomonas sp. AP19]OEC72906.1 hypothetical protein A7D21_27395 [Pseudomonas sp. AP19]
MNATYQTIKIEADLTTGELLEVARTYTITPLTISADKYEQLTTTQKPVQTPLSLEHTQDALRLKVATNDAHIKAQELSGSDVVALPVKRVTRPKKITINDIAKHVMLADVQEESSNGSPHQNWVEDYVMGACYTVAGANKGKLNVNPAHIFTAVKMDVISTESVRATFRNSKGEPLGKTQVSLIAQCARFALTGMQMHLDRNPTLYDALQTEVDFITAYYEQGQAIAA